MAYHSDPGYQSAVAAAEAQKYGHRMQAQTAGAQLWAQQQQYLQTLSQKQSQAVGIVGMLTRYQQAFQQAKAANEAKYQEALGVVGTTTGQQRADVMSQSQGQRASAMQNLARLGMSGTTIAPTMQAGIQREQQSALNRISDQMMQAKLGVMRGFEHKYPESGMMQSALGALPQW